MTLHAGTDGGLAFPGAGPGGITVRDYFAIKLLSALLSTQAGRTIEEDGGAKAFERRRRAVREAYAYADAMLYERPRLQAAAPPVGTLAPHPGPPTPP